jgi:hypothetical protein
MMYFYIPFECFPWFLFPVFLFFPLNFVPLDYCFPRFWFPCFLLVSKVLEISSGIGPCFPLAEGLCKFYANAGG